jgi:hypothetical protein
MRSSHVKGAAAVAGWALAALGLGAGPTSAQAITSPYRFLDRGQSIGPFAGYIAASKGSIGFGPSSGPVFGARYGIRITGPFTLEAEAAYFPTTRAVLDTVPADTTVEVVGEADLALAIAWAALRFNLTGPRTFHGVQPFLLFGGGAAIDVAGDAAAEEDLAPDVRFDFGTSFAGELGAGIEWFLSPSAALRLDGRNLLWRLKTPLPFLQGARSLVFTDREWAQNFQLSAGFSLYF